MIRIECIVDAEVAAAAYAAATAVDCGNDLLFYRARYQWAVDRLTSRELQLFAVEDDVLRLKSVAAAAFTQLVHACTEDHDD